MRPSTYSLSPFLTYFSTMSASCELFVFHTTQRCHSVFSCFAPAASFHDRLVASENVATRLPPVVDRTSGSFPKFPISVTLFRLLLTVPPGEKWVQPRRSRYDPVHVDAQPIHRASTSCVADLTSQLIRHRQPSTGGARWHPPPDVDNMPAADQLRRSRVTRTTRGRARSSPVLRDTPRGVSAPRR